MEKTPDEKARIFEIQRAGFKAYIQGALGSKAKRVDNMIQFAHPGSEGVGFAQ